MSGQVEASAAELRQANNLAVRQAVARPWPAIASA